MAHIAKYKATSVGHMLAHYRRDESSLGRDNIDPKRVKNDMVVAHYTNKDGKLVVGRVVPREGEPNWGTVERRIERVNEAQKAAGKRATRKDAVVMADVVVTLPDNVRKGDEDRFFRLTYWYLSNKFGIDNMMGGYVHKDEVLKDGTPARDHMHAPFTPILDGRFNYKQMCPRSFYQSMHKELGDYLERCLGYRPEVELGEDTRARRVYTDKSVDIDRVRGAVDKAVVEPAQQEAERIVAAARAQAATIVRDAETRRDELVAQVTDGERRLLDVRMQVDEETDRLESVRRTAGRFEEDVEELEAIASLAERFDHAGRFEKRGMLDEIAARCDGLRGRVGQFVEEVREAVGRLGLAIADLTRRLGPRSARMTTKALKRDLAALERDCGEDDDRSPKARAAEAQRAARARDANRDDRPPQRSWSQSR